MAAPIGWPATSLARRVSAWFLPGSPGAAVQLGDLVITDLHPVKPGMGGNALNKAGRLVLRGDLEGRRVKLYEAANSDHARFIRDLSVHPTLADSFPRVVDVFRQFVLAEWVPDTGGEVSLSGLAQLQARLHRTSCESVTAASFDYWHDYLVPRFLRAGVTGDNQRTAEAVVEEVSGVWDRSSRRLMHPDLGPGNVVGGGNRPLKVIDNELVATGGLPLLDVCNTAYRLGPAMGADYGEHYLAAASLRVASEDLNVLAAAWLARLVGTAFSAGDLGKVAGLFDDYRRGVLALPTMFSA